MENIITKYIQFAIDNEYCANSTFEKLTIEKNVRFTYEEWDDTGSPESYSECEWLYILDCSVDVWTWYKNITDIITSKPFIEAIARGIKKHNLKSMTICDDNLDNYVNIITTRQAIAIRDNTLENFITKLLWKH